MTERWLPVPWNDAYEVSDLGRVRSWRRRGTNERRAEPRVLRPSLDTGGYAQVELWANGCGAPKKVHALVLELFVGPRPDGMQVRHLNGVPNDNRLENLCWGTAAENHADKVTHGTALRGSRNHLAVLTPETAAEALLAMRRGESRRALAKRLGCSPAALVFLAKGRTWNYLGIEPVYRPEPNNASRVLLEGEARLIRMLDAEKVAPRCEIAAVFGVSRQNVDRICSRKTYRESRFGGVL